jgi:hypothetical protein
MNDLEAKQPLFYTIGRHGGRNLHNYQKMAQILDFLVYLCYNSWLNCTLKRLWDKRSEDQLFGL